MNEMITLTDLSKESNVGRSLLHHYRYMGLIKPIKTLGKMTIYDRQSTLEIIKKIKDLQSQGNTLLQVKDLL